MRAVVYDAYGAPPRVQDVPDPTPPDGGVVVAVAASGVCRSDWHAWRGHDPVRLPHVPGHELAGRVAAVGAGVRRWQVGQRVTVPFVCGCGVCGVCRDGDPQVCPDQRQPGFTGWGSHAELVALHAADNNLVALPPTIGDVEAAALGCRFATAYRAVRAHGGLGAGQWLLVVGAGGVGLSALLIGVALGARVVVVDTCAAALAQAAALGAEHVLPAGDPTRTAGHIADLTGGGAHVGIDAVGHPDAARTSVLALRRRGRHVQAGLLLGDHASPPLPMDRVVAHELSLHGTHGLAAGDYPAMLDLVAAGIDLSALVGRVIGLDDAPAALMAMDAPATTSGMTVVALAG